MMTACKECGASTEWHDDAGSNICTSCGTLADSSQTILADPDHLTTTAVNTILKSLRGQGHTLAGQGKEARDARNQYAMSDFISSLAVSINASGLTPRTDVLFKQAMAAGSFRWGRKAKLVAGACLAIALREYRRPDSLSDIAYLLDEPCSTLTRTLSTIISLLNLSLTPVDPSIHITPLLTHLTALLTTPPHPNPLAAPLVSQLKAISLRSAANTATSLCTLLARLGPDHPLNSLPSPPTAVAVFLLALEAQCRSPLSHLGEIAGCLGASCHKTSRSLAMGRYKLIQDEICVWVEQVPWLAKYEQKTTNGKTRAKVGKRLIVARGITDVLQFQDEIWRGKLRPTVLLDMGDEKDDDDEFEPVPITSKPVSTIAPSHEHKPPPLPLASRPAKRQKIFHHPLRDATQFLLNPLMGPLPDCESPPEPITSRAHIRIIPDPQPRPPPPQSSTQEPPLSPPPFQTNAHHSNIGSVHSLRLQPTTSLSHSALSLPDLAPPPVTKPSIPPAPSTHLPPRPTLFRTHSGPSLPSYILTAPSPSLLRSRAPPTRLQLLTATRGTADAIDDEELFGEGEMEGFIRPPEEAEEMGRRLIGLGILCEDDWKEDWEEGSRSRKSKEATKGKGKSKGRGIVTMEEEGGQTKKSRVDLDALARFLDHPSGEDVADADDVDDTVLLGLDQFPNEDEDDEDSGAEDGEREPMWSVGAAVNVMRRSALLENASTVKHVGPRMQIGVGSLGGDGDGGEVVLDEWRPLSPDRGMGYEHGAYEEEYD